MGKGAFKLVPATDGAATRITSPGKKVRWSAALKERFFDHLAATGNVSASAASIGVNPASIYYLRRKDPGFAAQWREMMVLAYEMIETMLIGHALAGGGGAIETGYPAMPAIDKDLALRLLAAHRAPQDPKHRRGGHRVKRVTPEETDAAILRQLAVLDRRLKAEAAGE